VPSAPSSEVAMLFTRVRGIGILRTSPFGDSQKFAFLAFSEVAPGIVPLHTRLRCVTRRG
jgi:hypothetical protein